jgi:beta-N-acetylhexosaminidase
VVVSDDLEMAAVADRYDVAVLVEKGLNAGCDMFLVCHDADKQAAGIEAAQRLAERDSAMRARIEQALDRVRRLKQRYVGAPAAPSITEARTILRCGPHGELAARLAAVEVVDDRTASPVDLG